MLYKAINKSNNIKWIVADNEEEAVEFALRTRHVKSPENCTLLTEDRRYGNFYDLFQQKGDDITEIDTKKGVAACFSSGNERRWKVHEL